MNVRVSNNKCYEMKLPNTFKKVSTYFVTQVSCNLSSVLMPNSEAVNKKELNCMPYSNKRQDSGEETLDRRKSSG